MMLTRKIFALFLIGTYAVIFLHSAIPHIHHSETAVEVKGYHHEHHHHHHQTVESTDWLELLSGLVHDHEHQDSHIDVDDIYTYHTNDFAVPTHHLLLNDHFISFVDLFDQYVSETETDFVFKHPPILYEDILIGADPLRGPPLS